MKLIDLLVQELPKRGGWPSGCSVAYCSGREDVVFEGINKKPFSYAGLSFTANDSVSIDDYEVALAALKQPAWDGEGLPPVGCRIEYTCKHPDLGHPSIEPDKWYGGTIIAYYNECVWTSDNGIRHLSNTIFRTIRSQSDNRRYAAIEALFAILDAGISTSKDSIEIYDAIAAGKIPGIKLDGDA